MSLPVQRLTNGQLTTAAAATPALTALIGVRDDELQVVLPPMDESDRGHVEVCNHTTYDDKPLWNRIPIVAV